MGLVKKHKQWSWCDLSSALKKKKGENEDVSAHYSVLPALIMLIFIVITKTREGHLCWVCLEEKIWSKPSAFIVWAACLEKMTSKLKWRQVNRIKLVTSYHLWGFRRRFQRVASSAKYIRKGHASLSWWRSLSPETCLHWSTARRMAARTRPSLTTMGLKIRVTVQERRWAAEAIFSC